MSGLMPPWFPEGWTQLRLPRLLDDDDHDDDDDPDEGDGDRWSFGIVALDGHGRVTLPAAARAVFGDNAPLRVSTRGDAVVLRGGGVGRPVNVDGRGRLVVPVWLRDAAGPARSVLVAAGADPAAEPVAVLVPSRVLVGLAVALVGER